MVDVIRGWNPAVMSAWRPPWLVPGLHGKGSKGKPRLWLPAKARRMASPVAGTLSSRAVWRRR